MQLPTRQIHLDFHTSPLIPNVGLHFDAREFARTMKKAHVNSVTVFAKCHHGHLYYDTKHPARHPTLEAGLDLLGEQIEALHREGIRAPVYISVQCDEFAANAHPEWIALNADGTRVGPKPHERLPFQWQILDMSSPYSDYLAEQIEEVIRKYKPVDGVFLDMCWDQQSCSHWARQKMTEAGLDSSSESDRRRFAHQVVHGYMDRYTKLIDELNGKRVPIAFNSRPLAYLAEEKRWLRHVEIEALPSGGWGYAYFPLNVRYVRPFGLPYMGMTGRFHKSWSDFGGLKPAAALMYECSQMIAHGAVCSVGDQLQPNGTLDKASYELIGKAYAHVQACEPFCEGAVAETDIAVLYATTDYHLKPGDPSEGAMRILQELGHQFDFLPPDASVEQWKKYRLLIIPESVQGMDELRLRIERFVREGGRVLLAGAASTLSDGSPTDPAAGYRSSGPLPFETAYVRFADSALGNLPATDHVIYEQGLALSATADAQVLATVVEPYFQRSWDHFCGHAQTPPKGPTPYIAAAISGSVGVIAFPVFGAYAKHGNLSFRQLVKACVDCLLPDPLVQVRGPSHLEVSLMRQGSRRVLHVLSYVPRRRAIGLDLVEEPTLVANVELSFAWQGPAPSSVRLEPGGATLKHEVRERRLMIDMPLFEGHVMVVIDEEKHV